MFSILRPALVYTDISPDVCEHDEDIDAEEWSYEGRAVYRGALDVSYKSHELDVFWLYDDNVNRVGLAEHDIHDHSIFRSLWFRDNAFGTLLQEDWETDKKTIWSLMTPESYQDHCSLTPAELAVKTEGRLVIPEFLTKGTPEVYTCTRCNKTSLLPTTCYDTVKKKLKLTSDSLFIDESFIIYRPPVDSLVFKWLCDADLPLCRGVPEHSQEEARLYHSQLDAPQDPPAESPQEEAPPPLQTELQQLPDTEETPEQT
jgi:hypothetical protein